MGPLPTKGTVGVHALVDPLTWWVWVGGLVMVLGRLGSFSPDARERRGAVTAQQGRRPRRGNTRLGRACDII